MVIWIQENSGERTQKKHILVKQLVKVAQRKWDYGEHVTNFTLEVMLCLTFGVIFK